MYGYIRKVVLFFRLAARGPSLLSDWGCGLLNKLGPLAANQKNKATSLIYCIYDHYNKVALVFRLAARGSELIK